jgi:hypothetical protein
VAVLKRSKYKKKSCKTKGGREEVGGASFCTPIAEEMSKNAVIKKSGGVKPKHTGIYTT